MRSFEKMVWVLSVVSLQALVACSDGAAPSANGQAGQGNDIGEAGAAGAQAKDGVDGTNGKDGVDGTNGLDGTNGTNGTNGADGSNGANGKDGADGSNGTNGTNGKDGTNGSDGTNGDTGKTSLVQTSHELAGDHCAFAGVRVEAGLDQNADGTLSADEINAAQTQYVCNTAIAWDELAPLPTVTNAYGFALALNDQDGTPRLGFMFNDDAYRQQLLGAGGVLWDGGGVYTGAQVLGIYKLGGELGKTWLPYEGRLTPQTYQYSQLSFNAGASYYTTMYPSFGGLVSVVKSGQYGTYALTPAFTTRRAHSVGFFAGQLFAIIAQKTIGLTLSTFPNDKFGMLSNLWTNLATLETDATAVSDPQLLPTADRLVAVYVLSGKAYVRASTTPQSVAQVADFPVIGQVNDARHVSAAWDGAKLYLASVAANGTLTVQRTSFADGATWETVTTHVLGAVSDLALSGSSAGVLLSVRQGGALRVYLTPADTWPSFDAVLPGSFSLVAGNSGSTLAVLNLDAAASHTLRTFRH